LSKKISIKQIGRLAGYNLLAVIVLLAVMELTTRSASWMTGRGFTLGTDELEAYDPGIESIYAWHPFTGFTFRPDRIFIAGHHHSGERVRHYTDSHGFLCPRSAVQPRYEKPANEIRIAFIGASTTANLNLPYAKNWPGHLGRRLQKKFPGKRVRIINAAVPGYDTAESLGNLALRVMPFDPDVVIIYHLYNDLKVINRQKGFQPDYAHVHDRPLGYHEKPHWMLRFLNNSMFYVRTRAKYREMIKNRAAARLVEQPANDSSGSARSSAIPGLAMDTFRQHMVSLVSIAQGEGTQVILSSFATLHDPGFDWSAVDRMESLLSPLQKTELVSLTHFTPGLTLEGIFAGVRKYNEVLKQIARSYHTGWVDNARLIPHEDACFIDRVHFSEDGARRMAENFFPAVVLALEERTRGID